MSIVYDCDFIVGINLANIWHCFINLGTMFYIVTSSLINIIHCKKKYSLTYTITYHM